MKKLLLILSLCILSLSCEKTHWNNPTVDQFVTLLQHGNYDSPYLPDFKPEDIERLLHYANDFRKIERFPVNPISSLSANEFRLGECLLWTIESIRLKYDQANPLAKFPSLNPQLIIADNTINYQNALEDDLLRAYNQYLTWWDSNKSGDFENFRFVNPLTNSGLIWR